MKNLKMRKDKSYVECLTFVLLSFIIIFMPSSIIAQSKKPPVKLGALEQTPDKIEMVSSTEAKNRKIKAAVEIDHPIYEIDGKRVADPTYLGIKAEDIKEVKILKVAEAKAKYGEKGLNGAVHIFTNSGNGAPNVKSTELDPLYREKYTWAQRANPSRYAKKEDATDLFLLIDDN